MALPIPKRYAPAISKILALPEPTFEDLINGLGAAPVIPHADGMAAHIATKVASISSEELGIIVDAVYALYHVREYSGLKGSRFLSELVDGIQENTDSKYEEKAVREKFKRLLNVEALNSLSKALTIQRDGERLYCGSKILSDIRPVFGKDVDNEPIAAVITHSLKIGYHDSEDHKEFFVVLDQEDLVNLHATIQRAISKSETLDGLLKRITLPRLGI